VATRVTQPDGRRQVERALSTFALRLWFPGPKVFGEEIAGEQLDYTRRKFTIPVPAEGERVIRVTYETRW
ncbi:MAG: hypothetical protein AAFQ13_06995, partial [Pseudomonadota bacterium]